MRIVPYRSTFIMLAWSALFSWQVAASDMGLQPHVDDKGHLHVMWFGENEATQQTTVTINGPVMVSRLVYNSWTRFDGLPAGSYDVVITRDGVSQTSSVVITTEGAKRDIVAAKAMGTSLNLVSFDAGAYPAFALQFRAADATGTPITNLEKGGFVLTEQGLPISNFDFRAPDTGVLTKIADVVVVFDDTGSMGGEITALQDNIKKFADQLVATGVDVQFRLISYKDDANDGWFWTKDVELFKSHIASLRASGGNNTEEDGFEALDIAANYDFRSGAQRVFLFVTDAPSWEGKDEYGKPTPTKAEIIAKLQSRGVNIYAIAFNNSQYNGSGSITAETGGAWYAISDDFSAIVSKIGNTVGSGYQIAWVTPNTSAGSIEIVLHHTSGAELKYTYVRSLPPEVTAIPDGVRKVGSDIKVEVFSRDPEGNALKDAGLSYREHRADGSAPDTWKQVKTADNLNTTNPTRFFIPGVAVTSNGLDFSVWVEDELSIRGNFPTGGGSQFLPVVGNPELVVISHGVDIATQNLIIKLTLTGIAETITPRFFYQGTSTGVFVGTPEMSITPDTTGGQAVYRRLSDGSYEITITKGALVKTIGTSHSIVAVLKVIAKLGEAVSLRSEDIDYPLAVRTYAQRHADTIILTNLKKMTGATGELVNKIGQLVTATWQLDANGIPDPKGGSNPYNMLPVVIDLDNAGVLTGDLTKSFQFELKKSDGTTLHNATADAIAERLQQVVADPSSGFRNGRKKIGMFLVLVGGNSVIPYGVFDDFLKANEGTWFKDNGPGMEGDTTLSGFYSGSSRDGGPYRYASDVVYRNYFRTGRMIETPSHISTQIGNFQNKKGYVLTAKKALYFGGYDRNGSSANGFVLTRTLKKDFKDAAANWNTDGSIHDPTGVDGAAIVKSINESGSAIISLHGHGSHNFIRTTSTSDGLYVVGSGFNGVVNITRSLSDSIILTNSSHAGVNVTSAGADYNTNKLTDFPESFVNDAGNITVNRALAVYVANTAYGSYVASSNASTAQYPQAGDQLIHMAVKSLTRRSSKADLNIYDELFRSTHSSVVPNTRRADQFARPQFYGVPNYRLGPAPATKAKQIYVTEKTATPDAAYLTVRGVLNGTTLDLRYTLNIGDGYHYAADTGRLTVQGVDKADQYGRPVLSSSLPLPEGAIIGNVSTANVITQDNTYTVPLMTKICNSFGCEEIPAVATSFDAMPEKDIQIEDGLLNVRLIPEQYKTDSKQTRIIKKLDVQITVNFPVYVADTDGDGMPDYWERHYGFNSLSSTGNDGPNGNPDADASINVREYMDQTDPTVNNSLLDDKTPPAAPSNVTASAREGAVDITFVPPADAVEIQFAYGTDKNALVMQSSRMPVTGGAASISMLSDATTYHLVARVFDAAGNISAPSTMVSFNTPAAVSPQLPKQPSLIGEVVAITNPIDPDLQGFRVYISDNAAMSGAQVVFIAPGVGASTQVHLGSYLDQIAAGVTTGMVTLYVQVAALDDNNHEGGHSVVITVTRNIVPPTPPVNVTPIPSLSGLAILTLILAVLTMSLATFARHRAYK